MLEDIGWVSAVIWPPLAYQQIDKVNITQSD